MHDGRMINASTRTRSPASNLADRKCVKGGVQTLVYDKPAGASDAFEPKSKGAPKTFRRSFFDIIEFISFGVEAGLPPYFCFW